MAKRSRFKRYKRRFIIAMVILQAFNNITYKMLMRDPEVKHAVMNRMRIWMKRPTEPATRLPDDELFKLIQGEVARQKAGQTPADGIIGKAVADAFERRRRPFKMDDLHAPRTYGKGEAADAIRERVGQRTDRVRNAADRIFDSKES